LGKKEKTCIKCTGVGGQNVVGAESCIYLTEDITAVDNSNSALKFTKKLRKWAIFYHIFTRESSYCYQRILAIAILSVCLSVCPSVRLSHGWISQKRCKPNYQFFTVGCLENSSFRNRKAFP